MNVNYGVLNGSKINILGCKVQIQEVSPFFYLAADKGPREDKVLVDAIIRDQALDGGEIAAVDSSVEAPDHLFRRILLGLRLQNDDSRLVLRR